MRFFSLHQGMTAVVADFAFYGLGVLAAAGVAVATLPQGQGSHSVAWALAWTLAWVLSGALVWTLAEYLMHRFVLHGVQPFKRWHALHHESPRAHIATPTLFTAAGFALFVVAPAWWLAPPGRAGALVLGVLAGYLVYIVTHHAVHHARRRGPWLRGRSHWHARHHGAGAPCCYGVSLPLWDHVFGSARR